MVTRDNLSGGWSRFAMGSLCLVTPIVLVDYLAPAWVPWLVAETGPVQLLQAAFLVSAVGCLALAMWRGNVSETDRSAATLLLFLCFVLAWREIEIDNQIWDVHAFSWKFLFEPELPLPAKIGLAVPGILLPIGVAFAVLRRPLREILATMSSCPGATKLIVWGLSLLAVSQLWDKGRTIARHWGWTMFLHLREEPNPLPEETLELLGEMFVLCAAVAFVRKVTRMNAPSQFCSHLNSARSALMFKSFR